MTAVEWASVASAFATVVLVIVTGYYAYQNYRMVQEMRTSRSAEVRPKLVPAMDYWEAATAFARIVNVGRGPALDVDVQLVYEPGGTPRRYCNPVLLSGEVEIFWGTGGAEAENRVDMDEIVSLHSHLRLSGSCKDVLGTSIPIEERIELRETWRLLKASSVQLQNDWEHRKDQHFEATVKELGEIRRILASRSQQAQ